MHGYICRSETEVGILVSGALIQTGPLYIYSTYIYQSVTKIALYNACVLQYVSTKHMIDRDDFR